MQSPESITPPPSGSYPSQPLNPEALRTRALGAVFIALGVLSLPLVGAALFYGVRLAALNWHAMVEALRGCC